MRRAPNPSGILAALPAALAQPHRDRARTAGRLRPIPLGSEAHRRPPSPNPTGIGPGLSAARPHPGWGRAISAHSEAGSGPA
jgi:hypothetical protein